MSKLYVGNISWDTSEEKLAECFRQCGDVLDSKIILDRDTGRSKGFGFVTMGSADQAREAQEQLDGHMLDGRPLRVNEARDRDERGRSGGGRGTSPQREYRGGGDSGMRRGRDDRGGHGGRGSRRSRDY